MLDNTKILSIEYNIKDFEVASGQVIIKVQKCRKDKNKVKIIDAENKKQIEVEQSTWRNPNDQYKFRFNTCSLSSEIIKKIKFANCPTLKSLYPKKNLRTCVMLLNMEDLFVFDTPNKDLKVKVYPYYQGSKGLKKKYAKMESTKYFHYNKPLQDKINDDLKEELTIKGVKNKKRLGLGETIIYDNPKVYIRQSAKEIIASYDELPSSANNSLYIFSLRNSFDNTKMFLKFLCGLLNTELITFYAQQEKIIRYSNGKQPQLKTSDLYLIPIPIYESLQVSISNLVNDIYLGLEVEENKKQIDKIIYSYFNITDDEINIIRSSIESF